MTDLNLPARLFVLSALRNCLHQEDELFLKQVASTLECISSRRHTESILKAIPHGCAVLRQPIPSTHTVERKGQGAERATALPFALPQGADPIAYWLNRISVAFEAGLTSNTEPIYAEDANQQTQSAQLSSLSLHSSSDFMHGIDLEEKENNHEFHLATVQFRPFNPLLHTRTAGSAAGSEEEEPGPNSYPAYAVGGRPGRLHVLFTSNRLFSEEPLHRLLLRLESPEFVHIDPNTGTENVFPAVCVTLTEFRKFGLEGEDLDDSDKQRSKKTHRIHHLLEFLRSAQVPSAVFFHLLAAIARHPRMYLPPAAEDHLQEFADMYRHVFEDGPWGKELKQKRKKEKQKERQERAREAKETE
jgi:hypothetical protein